LTILIKLPHIITVMWPYLIMWQRVKWSYPVVFEIFWKKNQICINVTEKPPTRKRLKEDGMKLRKVYKFC